MWFSDRLESWGLLLSLMSLGLSSLVLGLAAMAVKLWLPKLRFQPDIGRLGAKLEGSGKVRIFAIGNPIWQALLRPFHEWCMSVLVQDRRYVSLTRLYKD